MKANEIKWVKRYEKNNTGYEYFVKTNKEVISYRTTDILTLPNVVLNFIRTHNDEIFSGTYTSEYRVIIYRA